jgi:hypothetical protein
MRRLMVYLTGLVLLAGCGLGEALSAANQDFEAVALQAQDVVGAWAGEPDRTVTFKDDGTFSATTLPYDALVVGPGYDGDKAKPDGSGTWHIDDTHIQLTFQKLAGKQVSADGYFECYKHDQGFVFIAFDYAAGTYGGGWDTYRKKA